MLVQDFEATYIDGFSRERIALRAQELRAGQRRMLPFAQASRLKTLPFLKPVALRSGLNLGGRLTYAEEEPQFP